MFKKIKKQYSVYAREYITDNKMNYSEPKIYTANGDVKKRWYVYFYYRDPDTDKMKKQASLTMGINRKFKTRRERLKHFKILQRVVHDALKGGWSPYEKSMEDEDYYPAGKVIEEALELKLKALKPSTQSDYTIRIESFLRFLDKEGLYGVDIRKIERKTVLKHLNQILDETSARNYNNTRSVISSIFTVLEQQDYIPYNFVKTIVKQKTQSKRDRTISSDDLDKILTYLEKEDPLLSLYVEFISYFFLRPIEVARLRVGDINLTDKLISVEIKQKEYKTKIIPELIFDKIKKHIPGTADKDNFVFAPDGVGQWPTKESNKRDYYSKRFKKVKDELKLDERYTLYSFRHTYITKVYKELRKTFDKDESMSKLRLITGHESDAIYKYIHYIDAELPEDYSDLLK